MLYYMLYNMLYYMLYAYSASLPLMDAAEC